MILILAGVAIVLVAVAGYDLAQRKHAILRNFPIVGHFRYWLEAVGPELRQYIVTDKFRDPDLLLDFAERIATETGLPVGIKSAVGEMRFWRQLTGLIATTGRSVDFVTIDGGEGGTGAAPLVFADRVGRGVAFEDDPVELMRTRAS